MLQKFSLILLSFGVVSALNLPAELKNNDACTLEPVSKRTLDGKIAMIDNQRFNDGVIGSSVADAIRHEKCDNGYCKWIFHACHIDTNYDAQIFAIENKHGFGALKSSIFDLFFFVDTRLLKKKRFYQPLFPLPKHLHVRQRRFRNVPLHPKPRQSLHHLKKIPMAHLLR